MWYTDFNCRISGFGFQVFEWVKVEGPHPLRSPKRKIPVCMLGWLVAVSWLGHNYCIKQPL